MSVYDITDDEPDPLDPYLQANARQSVNEGFKQDGDFNFCPYCGRAIKHETYQYCPKCGNDIGERQ